MEERSAGAVVFKEGEGGARSYLLLLNNGRWDFPKGNMEEGETELQTVLREVAEETALSDLSMVPGFRRVVEYFYRRDGKNVHKEVVYLLARSGGAGVKISFEHQGFEWLDYGEAKARATYQNSRNILEDAEAFLAAPG